MMYELRKIKIILKVTSLHIQTGWLPSVANKFADGL